MNMNCESEFVGRRQLVWGMPSLAVTHQCLCVFTRVCTFYHKVPTGVAPSLILVNVSSVCL